MHYNAIKASGEPKRLDFVGFSIRFKAFLNPPLRPL